MKSYSKEYDEIDIFDVGEILTGSDTKR